MRMARGLFLVFSLLLVAVAVLADEKRWVSGEGTALKTEASTVSDSIIDVQVGTEVTIVESAGRWLKVRTLFGKEGWVYAGRVSETPPVAEVAGDDGGLFGANLQKSQINTAKADSARSIRGLSPEAARYAKDRGTPEVYKRSLDVILARKVSAKELKEFLKEGNIGEYSLDQGGVK